MTVEHHTVNRARNWFHPAENEGDKEFSQRHATALVTNIRFLFGLY